MDYSGRDLLSDLPLSIIHSILALVPIKDAIKTSILSRQWRYTWTSLPYLVFEDECANIFYEMRLKKFITRALFRHKGPIQKFKSRVAFRDLRRPNIDEWVHCLSRNDIRELTLILDKDQDNRFELHSSLYYCKKLTYLELTKCVMDPPLSTFKGFLYLKCLVLQEISLFGEEIESLVSHCPLLERLELIEYGNPEFIIRAPNLKYLVLIGDYLKICLYAPLLAKLSLELRDGERLQRKTLVCNFSSIVGAFANLEKLSGSKYFTKYLSIGIESSHHSLALHHLKVIKLRNMNFENKKEVSAVVRLLIGAPNLCKLDIRTNVLDEEEDDASEALDISFRDFRPNFTFEKLRVVKMSYVKGLPFEIEFMKFLIESSPMLETMDINHLYDHYTEEKRKLRAELRRCCRAFSNAKLSIY